MTVQSLALDGMTAEELLTELARPQTSETDRTRLREWLVRMHAPLARQIAYRCRNRGEPMEDLIQAAYVGMVKAINGFDATLGHAFQGYAAVTMLGEVKRHFRDRTWAVRVPHRYQERRAALNRAIAECTHDLGRSPTSAELAHRMGITEEETAVLLLRFYGDLSQAEIAAELGISQMHVSRILRAVLGHLRDALCDQPDVNSSAEALTGSCRR
ncbi:sigma-70 family RNA polymerase sigma factor [Nonomuraea sp. NPDC003201]